MLDLIITTNKDIVINANYPDVEIADRELVKCKLRFWKSTFNRTIKSCHSSNSNGIDITTSYQHLYNSLLSVIIHGVGSMCVNV